MICTTVREGQACAFMAAKGCAFNGGVCHESVQACEGCARSKEFSSGWFCTSCPDPATKWKIGNCNLATHVTTGSNVKKDKINPLKASKRGSR